MCDMAHSYVRHGSFICATWLIHMCDMAHSYVRHGSFICATWFIHMCDMAHSYVRHGSFICATWLIHMCDMTYSYVRYVSFIRVTWLMYMTHVHFVAARFAARVVCAALFRQYISVFRHDSFLSCFLTWIIPFQFFDTIQRNKSCRKRCSRLQIGWYRIWRLFLKNSI